MPSTRKPIRVLICNQHAMFRDGIKALLGEASTIKIVGEAGTAQRAINLLERVHPDIVLMDTVTPDLRGDEATEKIKAIDPHVQVLILSLDEDGPMVSRCLRAGAAGYVPNDNHSPELRDAIDTAFGRCTPRNSARRNVAGAKRRRSIKARSAAILVGLGMCFGNAAQAQDPHNGFFLTSPLGLSSGWDQNFVNGDQQLNDTEALLTGPTFAWMKSTHTTDFSLDYQPEFEFFAHNPGLDAWNHQSRLRLLHRASGRISVDVGNYFVSTNDPTRVLSNSLLLLPLGRFDQNSFYAGLTYRLDHRTKVTFRAENTFTHVSGITGQLADRLNDVGSAGTATIEHKFGSSQELTGSYSFLHVDPLGNSALGGASNVNLFNAGYSYTINPDLVLQLSAGVVQGTQDAMLGAAALQKRVKNVWLAGGYQRYVSFFGELAPLSLTPAGTFGFSQGFVPSNVYQVVAFRAWGQITKRVGIEVGAQRALSGVNLLGQDIRGNIFHTRVDYRINDRFVWFARAEYYNQNVAEFIPFANSRRRYTAGIEIALTRPTESIPGRSRRGPLAPDDDHTNPGTGVPEER